ncbi:cryptochrome/photolyase family protein [Oceanospirillum beijerinckii]|uniref:cryptochrome/photolyase family protein n=1 Tax=Oceanospirillum beijerinckii TaxID=64976 RepID=UPI0003F701D3|nr:FAD-binding domain-containing protein [Oceanospirillum beijerinckii]
MTHHPQRILVWFRSDLRVHDNPALWSAYQALIDVRQQGLHNAELIACFLRPQRQWQQHDWGYNKQRFVERCLLDLKQCLAEYNIPLLTLDCDDFQCQQALLIQLCQQLNCKHIFANEEPEFNERQRDYQLEQQALNLDIHCQFFHDQSLIPMGQLLKNDGTPYRVYSAFRKRALQSLEQNPVQLVSSIPKEAVNPATSNIDAPNPTASIRQSSALPLEQQLIQTLENAGQASSYTGNNHNEVSNQIQCYRFFQPQAYSSDPIQQQWPCSERQAITQLNQFCQDGIGRYAHSRDIPSDRSGTSQLSALQAAGKLSMKLCWQETLRVLVTEPGSAESAGRWRDELLWREFYRHLLVLYPQLCRYQPFKTQTQALVWRDDQEGLERWQQGKTGFPLVDAAMRQLLETGWMHNRLRMLTAVFLSKYLLIDWRHGERWFMQHLVDGDLASNNGGWQWAASTGTDAVPYFRLLSPYRQAERFDAKGTFIARYVPELEKLPAKQRIQPKGYVQGYPSPMVDLSEARERMLSAFKAL